MGEWIAALLLIAQTAPVGRGVAFQEEDGQQHFRALWNQPWTEECQSRLPLPGGPINISAWAGIEANAYATAANGSVVGGPTFNGDVVATLYPHFAIL